MNASAIFDKSYLLLYNNKIEIVIVRQNDEQLF